MNTYNFNDKTYQSTTSYQNFIKNNPRKGYLKIRASAASQALPISNIKIVVFKMIDGNNIVFYEGTTDNSGVIEKIILPAPILNNDNLLTPSSTMYEIRATYPEDNLDIIYKVNIYENIYTTQTINVVPTLSTMQGERKWL